MPPLKRNENSKRAGTREFTVISIILLALFSCGMPRLATAETAALEPLDDIAERPAFFSTELPTSPNRPRNYLLPPLISFLLPGFDQWTELQFRSAALYSGAALGGLMLASPAENRLNARGKNIDLNDLSSRDDDLRTLQIGSQIYMAAGSFSAYASFRAAVRSRQPNSEFTFLTEEETTDQLLLAPFDFHQLERPTTWIPLAVLFIGSWIDLASDGQMFRGNSYSIGDTGFAAGSSYLAGTNEEALFRGYLMPATMQLTGSPFWSNTGTAVVFAAAHLSSDHPLPLPQLAFGWYLGYLTQRNHWTLRQGIFLHAWWDAIAITSDYLYQSRDQRKSSRVLALPLLKFTF